ncbi:hypothetical protein V5O48_007980 [Marasmius crinis-equi]|uniref:1-alkyl-2-acetylglycerophosphocholine esterase n=1 Tax=Marasmius crinis-equi TaxID=585013 RepID=A0ABR3FFJ2_9AGAR
MLSLEEPKGYPVGATTFLCPLPSPVRHGSVKISGHEESGLLLEEVAFTAYYPAEVDSKTSRKGLHWITRPLSLALQGFIQFSGVKSYWITRGILAPLVYVYGRLIQIPVYANARLLRPKTAEKKQWPLVIFSHGLGGSRTAYSQICSRIAASGRVVLAIEHRDGTSHACQTRSWDAEGKCTLKPILYINKEDAMPDQSRSEPQPLRTDQLLVRHHEVYHTFETFSRFVAGDVDARLEVADDGKFKPVDWLPNDSGEPPVSFDDCFALIAYPAWCIKQFSILSSKPPAEYHHIPIRHALIYDPWLEPFPTPGPLPIDGTSTTEHHPDLPRMLVMNSEPFTRWDDHFLQLHTAVKKWGPEARLITLDFTWLPLIGSKAKRILLEYIENFTISFLDGRIEEKLKNLKPCELEIRIIGKKKDGSPKREIVGELGDVIVH